MPGVYRLKSCPNCGTQHRKRAEYCSKACTHAHKKLVVSDETRAKLSEAGKRRYEDRTSDEYLDSLYHTKQARESRGGADPTPIPPRKVSTYLRDGEVIDGDYWIPVDD